MILDMVRVTRGWNGRDRQHTLKVWFETSLGYPSADTLRRWIGEVPKRCRDAFDYGYADLYGDYIWRFVEHEQDPERVRYALLGFLLKRATVLWGKGER